MEFRDDGTGERIPIVGCPLGYVTTQIVGWLGWHALWQRGVLPCAGGLLDQPAKYVDVMELLDMLIANKPPTDHADRR